MTPNVAIIDPQFVLSLPKRATADTGMDVLTHAIEAYISNMANDYTDGLALQAMDLVFTYLKRAYENGQFDLKAREKMHNASCIAGMAFTNAFLGLSFDNCVIATGGGSPCQKDAMEQINAHSRSVYLQLSENEIVEHLLNSKKKRPLTHLLNEPDLREYVHKTLAIREKYYLRAHIVTPLPNSIEELVQILS